MIADTLHKANNNNNNNNNNNRYVRKQVKLNNEQWYEHALKLVETSHES